MKRDVQIETCTCKKRPVFMKRDLSIESCVHERKRQKMNEVLARSLWKENCMYKNALEKTLMNRDLCIWKEQAEDG